MIGNCANALTRPPEKRRGHTVAVEEATVAQREAEEARQQAESAKKDGMLAAAGQPEGIGEILPRPPRSFRPRLNSPTRARMKPRGAFPRRYGQNEMNATVQEVARNATSASAASADTKEKAQAGSAIVWKGRTALSRYATLS